MVDFLAAAQETKTQYEILKYLNSIPMCKAIKVISANEAGTPDIFCAYRGCMIVIEVKASEQHAKIAEEKQKRQILQLKQWAVCGIITSVVWSVAQVEAIIASVGKRL